MENKRIMAILAVLAMAFAGIGVICDTDVSDADSVEVARVGDQPYTSLTAAIEAGSTDAPVVLQANVVIESTIVINKDVTIDMNGHNITITDNRAFWIQSGDVKFTGNGTISANKGNAAWDNSSSVIRIGNGGSYTQKDEPLAAALEIGEGVTVSTDHAYGVTVFGADTEETLVLKGRVLVSGEVAAISGNGNDKYTEATITIASTAQVTSANASGIYLPNKGMLNIAGQVTGKCGIEMKGGNTVINIQEGAVITATADTTTHVKSNDGLSTYGYAIAVVENSGYVGAPSFSMSTGTVNGPVALVADDVVAIDKKGTITITGGTINGPISTVSSINGDQPIGDIVISGGSFTDISALEYIVEGEIVLDMDITIDDDLEIPGEMTFEIPSGRTLTVGGSLIGDGVLVIDDGATLAVDVTGSTLAAIVIEAGAMMTGIVNDPESSIFDLEAGELAIEYLGPSDYSEAYMYYYLTGEDAAATIDAPAGFLSPGDVFVVDDGATLTVTSLTVPFMSVMYIVEGASIEGAENLTLQGMLADEAECLTSAPAGAVAKVQYVYFGNFLQAVMDVASTDEVLVLLADFEDEPGMTVEESIIIDMNGHSFILTDGTLTIAENLTVLGTGSITVHDDEGASLLIGAGKALTLASGINATFDSIDVRAGGAVNGIVKIGTSAKNVTLSDSFLAGTGGFAVGKDLGVSGNVGAGTITFNGNNSIGGDVQTLGKLVLPNGTRLTIPAGATLTLGEGAELRIGNSASVDVRGELVSDTAIVGSVIAECKVIEGNTTTYTTLANAVAIAGSEATIVLLTDVVLTERLVIGNAVTIDLNRCSITANDINGMSVQADLAITGNGAVSLKAGKNVIADSIVVGNGADLTVGQNVNLTVNNILIGAGSSVTGMIVFDEAGNSVDMNGFTASGNGTTLKKGSVEISGTVSGGSIIVYGDARVTGNLNLVDTTIIVALNSKIVIPSGITVSASGESSIVNNGEAEISGTIASAGDSTIRNQGTMRILGAVDAASMENQGIVTVDGSLTAAELDNKLGATMDIYGSADVTSSSNAGTVNVYPGAQMTGNIEEARYYQLCIVVNGQSTKTVKAKDYVSFSVKALPEGTDIHLNVSWLSYDKARGIVSGYVPDTVGTYTVKMNASLDREGTIYDAEEVTLKIIVEPDTSGSVLDKASIAKIVLIIVVFIGLIFFISRYILRLA